MKVKLGQIFLSYVNLNTLCNFDVPIKLAYKLFPLHQKAGEQYKLIEDLRNKLIKKYSTQGNAVDQDKIQLFIEEFNQFLQEETELDWKVLKIDLNQLEGNKMSVLALQSLDWALDFSEEVLDGNSSVA